MFRFLINMIANKYLYSSRGLVKARLYARDLPKMSTAVLPICVVDDDPLVRKTIGAMLVEAGYEVVALAGGDEFLDQLDQALPGRQPFACVLLDVNMPGMDGLEVLRQQAKRNRHTPVIMISGRGDIATAVQAMRDGAVDFVEKPFTSEHLSQAVALAVSENQVPPPLSVLSSREMDVLRLLVEGNANKMIAYELGISQRTVEVHRARIMDRLEVKTFADLVRIAIAAGL